MLRESRGDGHVAALVSAGLDPCETLVMYGAEHGIDPAYLRLARGWSEAEWADAQARLAGRGLLTGDAGLTAEGAELRRWVEERTDDSAATPWRAIGAADTARVVDLLSPIALHIARANSAMETNPMGLSAVAELSRTMAERAG
jgi:Helix-turn-helix family